MKSTRLFIAFCMAVTMVCTCTIYANAQQWKPNKKYVSTDTGRTKKPAKAFQCWGTTKKGERCKRKVSGDHMYCYQHAGQQ